MAQRTVERRVTNVRKAYFVYNQQTIHSKMSLIILSQLIAAITATANFHVDISRAVATGRHSIKLTGWRGGGVTKNVPGYDWRIRLETITSGSWPNQPEVSVQLLYKIRA
jgi:hypothetical protein